MELSGKMESGVPDEKIGFAGTQIVSIFKEADAGRGVKEPAPDRTRTINTPFQLAGGSPLSLTSGFMAARFGASMVLVHSFLTEPVSGPSKESGSQ